MDLRHDALAAAAAFIMASETMARDTPGLVATVGVIHASPGAPNIIPGTVTCSLDIRHADDAIRDANVETILASATAGAQTRGVALAHRRTSTVRSVTMDPALTSSLAAAAERAGYPAHRMSSGAGHDAMILAPHVPAAMLFLRTPAGLSHHPDETVLLADVEAGLETCMAWLEALSV